MVSKIIMKYTIIILSVVFLSHFSFAEGTSEIDDTAIRLVWSATCPPDGVHAIGMNVFKNYLESHSNATVEIFTSGENLINIVETDACIEGIIDITYFDSSFFEDELPFLEMLNSAFIFNDYEHMKEVLNGEIGYELYNKIADVYGVRPLGAFYLGARQLNLVESAGEIRTPLDMSSVRVSCRDDDFSIAIVKALGGIPVPYSDFSEIYTGLSYRRIDAQDNEILLYKRSRFHRLTKTIVLTNHVIRTVWPVINEEKWQSISHQYQKIILEAIAASEEACYLYVQRQEQEAIDYFASIIFTIPTETDETDETTEPDVESFIIIDDPDIKSFTEYSEAYYLSDPVAEDWDMELYHKIRALR